MALCTKCLSIPPKLITSEGWAPYTGNETIRVEHHTSWTDLKRSADAGCPCCQALIFLIGIDEAPAAQAPVVLEKTHWQSFDVQYKEYSVSDWLPHKTLYGGAVPVEWSTRLPLYRARSEDDAHIYAKGWLQDCLANHKTCSATPGDFVPTRLLDLGLPENTKDVRVIVTTQNPIKGPYFALSHCWGKVVIATTTTQNLTERMRGISFEALSVTFQDAITFCRKVGIQYLWIDSLCILQDSREDWEKEAAVMGKVYEYALCTLAATCSSNGTGGCRVRHPMRCGSIDMELGNPPQRVRVWTNYPWRWAGTLSGMNEGGENRIPPAPLNTRAWTLQERQLSARMLHFTEYMVLWECKEHRASTLVPWGQSSEERAEDADFRLFDRRPVPETPPSQDQHTHRRRWFEIVDEYSTRNLTVASDKLPALGGMAQQLAREGGYGRYLAGLWESHLPSSLLWKAVPVPDQDYTPCARPIPHRAPSWSWVSLDGAISHSHLDPVTEIDPGSDRAGIIKQMSRDPSPRSTTHQDSILAASPLCTIHAVAMDYGGRNPFLSAPGGGITITGKIKEAAVRILDPEHREIDKYSDYNLLLDNTGKAIGAVSLDEHGAVADGEKVLCLAVELDRQWPNRRMPWGLDAEIGSYPGMEWEEEYKWWRENLGLGTKVLGLALKRSGERGGEMRRVGLVRWVGRGWFEDAGVEKVVLV